jgi:rhodanese-related sulfurtransferase
MVPALFLSSCKKEEENVAFDTLKTYMVDNDMDLPKMLEGWIQSDLALVDSVQNDADATNDFYIMDIRESADFTAGHIKGAVNCKLADVLTQATNAGTKKILIVCATGQTAGHANMALRLKGFSSQVLMWGMSGWNADFDKWTANAKQATDLSNWEAAPGSITANAEFDLPVITSDETEGEAILDQRINALLAGGLRGVNASDVLTTPSNYFINNYWAEADVTDYGHIKGAYRINPLSFENIKNLDAAKTVVTYCWTGQTSSMVTAWLFVLGYDAQSLKFGANGMIYQDLTSHKWSGSKSFTYEK